MRSHFFLFAHERSGCLARDASVLERATACLSLFGHHGCRKEHIQLWWLRGVSSVSRRILDIHDMSYCDADVCRATHCLAANPWSGQLIGAVLAPMT